MVYSLEYIPGGCWFMIVSLLPELKLAKERAEGRSISFAVAAKESGLSLGVITRLMKKGAGVERVDGDTLSALCRWLGCTVGELLVYIPSAESSTAASSAA
jgi:DNA-binding Xre family transcriptional regulator